LVKSIISSLTDLTLIWVLKQSRAFQGILSVALVKFEDVWERVKMHGKDIV